MKTANDISIMLGDCHRELEELYKDWYTSKSKIRKLEEKIKALKYILMYLEANPKEESIIRLMTELQNRIDSIDTQERFLAWYKDRKPDYKNAKAAKNAYDRIFDIPQVRIQIKTYQFILDKNTDL